MKLNSSINSGADQLDAVIIAKLGLADVESVHANGGDALASPPQCAIDHRASFFVSACTRLHAAGKATGQALRAPRRNSCQSHASQEFSAMHNGFSSPR